jgi:hypothetical protein
MYAEASVVDGALITDNDSAQISSFGDLPRNVTAGAALGGVTADAINGASAAFTQSSISASLGLETSARWAVSGTAEASALSGISILFNVDEPAPYSLSWTILAMQFGGIGVSSFTFSGPGGSILTAATDDPNGSQQGGLSQGVLSPGLHNLTLHIDGEALANVANPMALAISSVELNLTVIPAPATSILLAFGPALLRRRR